MSKRLLVSPPTSNESTKRRRIDAAPKKCSIARFEKLPNEILYEICDYLTAFQIFQSFSKLNRRFNNFLHYSSFPLDIEFDEHSKASLVQQCHNMITPNKHRVRSLQLHDTKIVDMYFNACFVDASFSRLESVILSDVSALDVLIALSHMKFLPRLFSFTVCISSFREGQTLANIYPAILSLPSLKYSKVSDIYHIDKYSNQLAFVNPPKNGIEHLHMDHRVTFEQLCSLLQYTPKLRRLHANLNLSNNTDIDTTVLSLTNLTHLSLNVGGVAINRLTVIKKICSQLEKLEIDGWMSENLLSLDWFRELVEKDMPHLQTLKIGGSENMFYEDDEYYDDDDDNSTISTHLPYWNNKYSEIKINDDFSEYLIKLSGDDNSQRPPDSSQYTQSNKILFTNDSLETSSGMLVKNYQQSRIDSLQNTPTCTLTILGFFLEGHFSSLFTRIERSFAAVSITHLNVNSSNFTIMRLLEICSLLPRLNSVSLSGLKTPKPRIYDFQSEDSFVSTWRNYQVTKLKYGPIFSSDDLRILLKIHHAVEYLEIDCSDYKTQLGGIIGVVACNGCHGDRHLACLCLLRTEKCIDIVNDLHSMIDYGRLVFGENCFRDYEVEHWKSRVVLKWSL